MLAKLEAQKAPVSQPVSPRRVIEPVGTIWKMIEEVTQIIENPENIPGSVVPTQPSFSRFNI